MPVCLRSQPSCHASLKFAGFKSTKWRHFENVKFEALSARREHNWFITPLGPQGKRISRLFKVEFKGDKIIGLCSKSYFPEVFPTENSPGQVKFSMKGVNKGQFKNPMVHYEHVLNTKENFQACNSGICTKDQNMVTYRQYKNVLTYFYPKRKVSEDGRSSVPLDI